MNITFYNRQMRGEDLRGLNIEDLQQLEKLLESGLGRVLETKVCVALILLQTMCVCVSIYIHICTVIHAGFYMSFTFVSEGEDYE